MEARAADPARQPIALENEAPEGSGLWQLQQKSGGRSTAFWVYVFALLFHAGLLLLQLPTSTRVEAREPDHRQVIRLVQAPRPKPPEPTPERRPPERTRRQPIPDPTPDGPEPLMADVRLQPQLIFDPGDSLVDIPAAPPEEEPAGPMDVISGVTAPVLHNKIEPKYTDVARRVGIQGLVILEAIIDEEGRVTQVKVLKPLGFGLDDSAMEAVRQARFTPAVYRGKPVAVYYRLTVSFTLN